MHPGSRRELKLGLLLITATALVYIRASVELVGDDLVARLPLTPGQMFLFGLAIAVAGIILMAAPIWVDRRGPHPVVAMGAAAIGMGALLTAVSNYDAVDAIGIGTIFVGIAGLDSYILLSLAARGTTQYRGALLGGLTATLFLPAPLGGALTRDSGVALGVAAVLSIVIAILLFRFLPAFLRVNPAPDPSLPGFVQLWGNPFMRKVLIAVGLIFFSTLTLLNAGLLLITGIHPSEGVFSLGSQTSAATWAVAIGALTWGLASDRLPASLLLAAAALLAMPMVGIARVTDAPAITDAAAIAFAFAFLAGGFMVLPYVLLADHLPTRRFGTLCIQLTVLGGIPAALLAWFTNYAMATWGSGIPAAVFVVVSLLTATAAWRLSPNQVPRAPIPQAAD